jgi:exosortase D (VPLPA-CTERM-specific)
MSLQTVWIESNTRKLVFLVAAALSVVLFWSAFVELERIWGGREEYSHAYFIPLIAAFFAWQGMEDLKRSRLSGSWWGIPLVLLGLMLFVLGTVGTILLVVTLGFIVTLTGLVLAYLGFEGLKKLWPPIFLLALVIPLPQFLVSVLSLKMQLISSQLGVELIRLFSISVFVEGNVIDLGSYKLQVVEACSGLNYLFPLLSIGFIVAYIYTGPLWQRVVVFLSSVPITILLNSLRIGLIGVSVEYWGIEMAEGILHDFEGWVFFMICTAILVFEVWVFWFLGGRKRAFNQVFGIDIPERRKSGPANAAIRQLPASLVVSAVLIVVAMVASPMLNAREELSPQRELLANFPLSIEGWETPEKERIEGAVLDELNLDDYLLANYRKESGIPVNFYVSYYSNQRARASVHSPRACLPGGGWQIKDVADHRLEGVLPGGNSLTVNRVLMQKGGQRQLVYYWFPQRGRNLVSEYLVKWYIFQDALARGRSDGAMVRMVTGLSKEERWEDADRRLEEFSSLVVPKLSSFVPN